MEIIGYDGLDVHKVTIIKNKMIEICIDKTV